MRESVVQRDTVVIFDSWTEGLINVERLVPAFRSRGLDLMLIHIGSWGHDQGRPAEEHIRGILVRDVKFYQGLSFREILRREAPAAVLFLSTQAFAHRAFNRYCRELNIPTLHLYHGVVGVQSLTAKCASPINLRSQLVLVWSRLMKNVFRLWPMYAKALMQTNGKLEDWIWFGRDVWRQIVGQSYSGRAAPDTATTSCCVYTVADVSHAVLRYRLDVNAVSAVGNPDLTKFGLDQADIGDCFSHTTAENRDIVYIDSALIDVGAVFDSPADFCEHMRQTNTCLAAHGYRLVIKLHPAHYRTGVAERLQTMGMELCPNDQFVQRLKTAAAVISEASSAALIPALLGIPLLLARYGKLAGQEYGVVLMSYPRSRELYRLDAVVSLLAEITANPVDVKTWIDSNAGPLPAASMPERVVAAFERIIVRRRSACQP